MTLAPPPVAPLPVAPAEAVSAPAADTVLSLFDTLVLGRGDLMWLLVLVPVVAGAYVWASRQRRAALLRLGNQTLVSRLVGTVHRGNRLVIAVVTTIAALFLVGALLRPHLASDALVLCLQNGVDNTGRLRIVLPQHAVAAAVVYVATEMAGPGHVRHHGRGDLVMEPSRYSDVVAQAFIAAGVPTEVSANVNGALWAKLVLNCAYNAVSAICQLPYGKTVAGEGVRDLMRDVVAECLAVAQAEGVQLAGDVHAAVDQLAGSMPSQFSSTAQDLARGKPTEIDYLNGFIVRRGEALGIATPANRVLWALVKLMEGKSC